MSEQYDSHGLTVTCASGFAADIIGVGGPSVERGTIETSHLLTTGGFKTYIGQKLVEGGELTLNCAYDGALSPPLVDAEPETVTLTHADSGMNVSFEGLLTGFDPKFELGSRMVADVKIKVCGAITGL